MKALQLYFPCARLPAALLFASFIRSHHSRTARPCGKAEVRGVDDGDA